MSVMATSQDKIGHCRRRFTPECEVLCTDEGAPDSKELYGVCKKNPGHHNFIPVTELKMEHLPPKWREEKVMDYIRDSCDMTVKVIVGYTSPDRPDTYRGTKEPYPYSLFKKSRRAVRCGTGILDLLCFDMKDIPCPCRLCKESGQPFIGYFEFGVWTATHVVFDNMEALETTCELFYDSEDRTGVKCLYGSENSFGQADAISRLNSDMWTMRCVTHDRDLGNVVLNVLEKYKSNWVFNPPRERMGFIVSHIHGLWKHFSVGTYSHIAIFPSRQICGDGPPLEIICRLSPKNYETSGSDQEKKTKKDNKSMKRHKIKHLDESLTMKHGVEYLLPPTQKLIMPFKAYQILSVYRFITYKDGSVWIVLNSETAFICPDGRFINFPYGAEFTWDGIQTDIEEKMIVNQYVYNIPTCPGSSGAPVRHDVFLNSFLKPTIHFGSVENGKNAAFCPYLPNHRKGREEKLYVAPPMNERNKRMTCQ